MTQFQIQDADEHLEDDLKQKLSLLFTKTRPVKFLQHLNNQKFRKLSLSSQAETFETTDILQEQKLKYIDTSQIKLNLIKNEIFHQNREEGNHPFKFSKSHPLERLHYRKKIIVQKKISELHTLNGDGIVKLEDGKVVFGKWKKGVFVGNAKIIYPSENIYIGEIKNYIRHGKGLLIFKNGERYVGNFANGKYNGYGTKYDVQFEKILEGVWRQGVLFKQVQ